MLKNRVRMFVGLLVGLLFMLLQAVFPELPFTEEQSLLFGGLIAAYIVGEGLEGARVLNNITDLFRSHKFLSLIAGLIVMSVQAFFPDFPITTENLTQLFVVLAGMIIGMGAEGKSKG